ncbi:MAG TPA: hypothetical protein VGD67_08435 [Pseudonocardiaceae bacterium]
MSIWEPAAPVRRTVAETTVIEIQCFVTAAFVPDATFDQLPADRDLLATGVLDERGLRRMLGWAAARYGVPVESLAARPVRTAAELGRAIMAARAAALGQDPDEGAGNPADQGRRAA